MANISPKNPEVARLRALARDRRERYESGRFLVEGPKLLAEALASGIEISAVYGEPDWDPPADLQRELDEAGVHVASMHPRGIERIATTTSPQPVVAECVLPATGLGDMVETSAILVAVDVNDPGNIGTLSRSAAAAGFGALVCLGDTVDPFGPKAIRASAGAIFGMTVVVERSIEAGLRALAEGGFETFGTTMTGGTACDRTDLTGRIALVLGNEANGLEDVAATHIDRWLTIPMPGDTESLNVAMAGTVLAYEVARQRRAIH